MDGIWVLYGQEYSNTMMTSNHGNNPNLNEIIGLLPIAIIITIRGPRLMDL